MRRHKHHMFEKAIQRAESLGHEIRTDFDVSNYSCVNGRWQHSGYGVSFHSHCYKCYSRLSVTPSSFNPCSGNAVRIKCSGIFTNNNYYDRQYAIYRQVGDDFVCVHTCEDKSEALSVLRGLMASDPGATYKAIHTKSVKAKSARTGVAQPAIAVMDSKEMDELIAEEDTESGESTTLFYSHKREKGGNIG